MRFKMPTSTIKALGNAQMARRLEGEVIAGLTAGLRPDADPAIGKPVQKLIAGLLAQANECKIDALTNWKKFASLEEAQAEKKRWDRATAELAALLEYLTPRPDPVGPEVS